MAVDWNREIIRRDGAKVRRLGVINEGITGRERIVVASPDDLGFETTYWVNPNGSYLSDIHQSHRDIINAPLTVEIGERWVCVFKADATGKYHTVTELGCDFASKADAILFGTVHAKYPGKYVGVAKFHSCSLTIEPTP